MSRLYITSDLFEAASLEVYDKKMVDMTIDDSKNNPECLFHFEREDVGELPALYRENKLLVDARCLKEHVVRLKKSMFSLIDNRKKG